MRIARLEFGGHTNQNLRILRRTLPQGMEIKYLTFSSALKIDQQLGEEMRPPFRAALSLLDRLQDAPLAAKSLHLLPSDKIGRLPAPTGHLYHAPLPPRLDAVYSVAPPLVRAAIPFVYRLSLVTGVLSAEQNPSLDEFSEKCVLLWYVDPNDHGFPRPSQFALKAYIRHIRQYAGSGHTPPERKQAPAPQAWTDLRRLMRQHGKHKMIQRTFGVSAHAIQDGLTPAKITPRWIERTLQILPRKERNAFRTGIFVFDDLIADENFPSGVLPSKVSGLKRERKPTRS